MKSVMLFSALCLVSISAYARCVVEILDSQSEPLGYVFQGDTCTEPKARCEQKLRTLNNPDAHCEVTMDIGSKKT